MTLSKETLTMGHLKDETSRRSFLKAGVAAVAALGLTDLGGGH